ncbi:GAF domain-containing protein [Psychroflexus sp. YR1-1]|uniref:GAF domain-containing protein n=1 Tax=Psychroflexus aurantiacus TaxID=2709310 RepID=A0A6B3R1Z2_9FLAO|nr:GAF domain-containing protein [Psychroflexus aurantiacus]NEV94068.1 GAF domain-containing protein [Psychroflexus aurantiacus]
MEPYKDIYPFQIKLSFQKIRDNFQKRLSTESNPISRNYIQGILDYSESYPELFNGIANYENLEPYEEQIKILLDDLFPDILTYNEIKVATVPFRNKMFRKTKRFESILNSVPDKDFEFLPRNFNIEKDYILACIIILNTYYKYNIDFFRPEYYDIPDADGNLRNYRLFVNADFVELFPTEHAPEITDADVDQLLNRQNDIDFWKEKFPPDSWIFKGFTILNLTDVTIDNSISELKTLLLNSNIFSDSRAIALKMMTILKSIFSLPKLEFGFALFNEETEKFQPSHSNYIDSFILNSISDNGCKEAFCHGAYTAIVNQHTYFSITDVDAYAQKNKSNKFANYLQAKGIKSAILAPVTKNDKLLAILELVSYSKNDLNNINATKLDDIVPYIAETVQSYKQERQNRIKAIIQNEYTSIHPSVEWKFEEEAVKLFAESAPDKNNELKEIRFHEVHPLFGQIDIADSSTERNSAIQNDLIYQLNQVLNIVNSALEIQALPVFEQLSYRLTDALSRLTEGITASTEEKTDKLLKQDAQPVLEYILKTIPSCHAMVEQYMEKSSTGAKAFHQNRDVFDETVSSINSSLASFIDLKQVEAQKLFPHYFDRYKTDGVEHNMYIGQSIAKDLTFSKVVLENLRLWQLSVMCEMENEFYKIQEAKHIKLSSRSLILAFNNTLTIHYRMDEKHFDVDGSYNARYEIIKKRIDKAFIKNSEERITSRGKLTIVYSQLETQEEYLKYITYLQRKKYLNEEVELVDVEDLQGVSGLKAIRVGILYHNGNTPDTGITYENLIESLEG